MKSERELQKLHREIKRKLKCSLCSRKKTVVVGEGNPNAKIMLIGEAPGAEEEKLGRPFVGRSGKLLDKLLEEINLPRESVYITSSVKCRPPKNRKPKRKEVLDCVKWLWKQIDFISPKLVVLLGTVAYQAIFEKPVKISDVHGEFIKKNGSQYLVTFHPSAAMRFPKTRELMKKDFKKILIML